ncbi:hypothetical protein [Tenacibaculum finnmarkense]|nr:hypothetical protein [Tenacibaculum finnmarkense]
MSKLTGGVHFKRGQNPVPILERIDSQSVRWGNNHSLRACLRIK